MGRKDCVAILKQTKLLTYLYWDESVVILILSSALYFVDGAYELPTHFEASERFEEDSDYRNVPCPDRVRILVDTDDPYF